MRDQVGATLKVDGAELILLKDGMEIGRSPVSKDLRGDFNYELRVSVDQNLPATRSYSEKAVAAGGLISVVVTMNGQQFYPIGVSGSLRATAGGERVRLDLNLGADTDGDGLPDAWEEWQLYIAGRRPGANGWDLSPSRATGISTAMAFLISMNTSPGRLRRIRLIASSSGCWARRHLQCNSSSSASPERSTRLKKAPT